MFTCKKYMNQNNSVLLLRPPQINFSIYVRLNSSKGGEGADFVKMSNYYICLVLLFQTKHDVKNSTVIDKTPYQWKNAGNLKN